VTYSPDCKYVAVTSIDDESVYLIDRALRRATATYRPVLPYALPRSSARVNSWSPTRAR
jgi:hypothetical protein